MTRVLAIVVAFAGLASPAFSQTTIPVAVDQRVRITTTDATHVGRVVGTAADSLRISIDNGSDRSGQAVD